MFLIMRSLRVLAAPISLAMAILAGCGGSGADSGDDASVVIKDYRFDDLTAAPGERVVVADEDPEAHTLTSVDGAFDTGSFDRDEPGSFTAPTEPGTYEFVCEIHPSMTGTLTVQ